MVRSLRSFRSAKGCTDVIKLARLDKREPQMVEIRAFRPADLEDLYRI